MEEGPQPKKKHRGKRKQRMQRKKRKSKKQKNDPYIHKRIARYFESDDGARVFFGTIDRKVIKNKQGRPRKIDPTKSKLHFWHVSYDDGDDEEVTEEEIAEALKTYKIHRDDDGFFNAEEESGIDEDDDEACFPMDDSSEEGGPSAKTTPRESEILKPQDDLDTNTSNRISSHESSSSTDATKKDPTEQKETKYINQRVVRYFDVEGNPSKPFFGTIIGTTTGTSKSVILWTVAYDDDDTEDVQDYEVQDGIKEYERYQNEDPKTNASHNKDEASGRFGEPSARTVDNAYSKTMDDVDLDFYFGSTDDDADDDAVVFSGGIVDDVDDTAESEKNFDVIAEREDASNLDASVSDGKARDDDKAVVSPESFDDDESASSHSSCDERFDLSDVFQKAKQKAFLTHAKKELETEHPKVWKRLLGIEDEISKPSNLTVDTKETPPDPPSAATALNNPQLVQHSQSSFFPRQQLHAHKLQASKTTTLPLPPPLPPTAFAPGRSMLEKKKAFLKRRIESLRIEQGG